MNPKPAIPRAPQPLLSRLLEQLLDAPTGTDESLHTTPLLSALVEDAQRERASDVHLDPKWVERFGQSIPKKTWHAGGCIDCSMTGYRGRLGVFEVWRLHDEEADLILKHTDEHTLRRRLRKQGMSSLLEDDLSKVSEGITTLAELQTVGGFGFYTEGGRGGQAG